MDPSNLQSVLRVTAWESLNLRISFGLRPAPRFLHNPTLGYVWIYELKDWNCQFEINFKSDVWSFKTSCVRKFPQFDEAFMWVSKRNDKRCGLNEWFEISWDFWITCYISQWCFDCDQDVWWRVHSICDRLSQGEYRFAESRGCCWTCKFYLVGFVLNNDVSV